MPLQIMILIIDDAISLLTVHWSKKYRKTFARDIGLKLILKEMDSRFSFHVVLTPETNYCNKLVYLKSTK